MLKMKDKKAFLFYFLMSIILVDFGNQIRKLSYLSQFKDMENPLFSIFHVYNTGGAFSILQNHTGYLIILSICALLYISWHVYKEVDFSDKVSLLSLSLFSAGTIGNLIERIQEGKVVDYIKLNFIDFPVFNAFDIMICIGIFIYSSFVFYELCFPFIKKVPDEKN